MLNSYCCFGSLISGLRVDVDVILRELRACDVHFSRETLLMYYLVSCGNAVSLRGYVMCIAKAYTIFLYHSVKRG